MAKTSMFVKLSAQPGKRDDLLAALEKMLVTVNDEEGTEIYAFNLDATDENAIWIYELYTDEARSRPTPGARPWPRSSATSAACSAMRP